MLYRAVIFDLFGTLVDSFSLQEHRRVLSEMAASLAVAPDEFSRLWFETYKERGTGIFPTVEANLEHICRVLSQVLEPEKIAAAARIRVDFTLRSLRPRPDAVRTLAQLKAWGKKIGLISDCSPDVPLLWKDTPFHLSAQEGSINHFGVLYDEEGVAKAEPEEGCRSRSRNRVVPVTDLSFAAHVVEIADWHRLPVYPLDQAMAVTPAVRKPGPGWCVKLLEPGSVEGEASSARFALSWYPAECLFHSSGLGLAL